MNRWRERRRLCRAEIARCEYSKLLSRDAVAVAGWKEGIMIMASQDEASVFGAL